MAWTDAIAGTVAAITAIGALGAAAFGVVDAFKAFGGGVSNVGFGAVKAALLPFTPALVNATTGWEATLKANWINGVAKEDQKTAAKTLIRLGLNAQGAAAMAAAGHIDVVDLTAAIAKVEAGLPLTPQDAQLFGRLNAVIDAAMDAGFERGDQQYRNASKLAAGCVAIILAWWAGYLMWMHQPPLFGHPATAWFLGSDLFAWSTLVGAIAVPIAPIAKDLASSLQSAATAVAAVRP